jgi:hypothetical protein
LALNKEIFVMMLFVVGIGAFLTLFLSTPFVGIQNGGSLNFNSTGSLTLGVNSNEQVGQQSLSQGAQQGYSPINQGTNCIGENVNQCTGDYQCTNANSSGFCFSTSSVGLVNQGDCINIGVQAGTNSSTSNSILNALTSIGSTIAAGFQNIALFISGQKTISPAPTQCNGVGTIQGTLSTFGAVITGQNGNPYTNSNYGTIDNVFAACLVIAGIFIGLGLLAGVFGAGAFANVIATTGIGMSLIFFFQGVFASSAFKNTPFILEIFIDAITATIFIWILMVLLRD